MEATCQCRRITFQTPLSAPQKLYICHCNECRHQSSSAFGISAIFPSFPLPAELIPHLGIYTRPTASGGMLDCYFCRTCGARVLHRSRRPEQLIGEGKGTVSIKGGCLKGLSREMVRHASHIWCKEAVVEIPEGVERWEEEPED